MDATGGQAEAKFKIPQERNQNDHLAVATAIDFLVSDDDYLKWRQNI